MSAFNIVCPSICFIESLKCDYQQLQVPVAQLWQRDRAKLDMFAIKVQRYSQTHAQICIFGPPYEGIEGKLSTLFERVNTKRLCSRVSSRECQFYS